MGFAPTWLRQVSPLLHVTTLTTGGMLYQMGQYTFADADSVADLCSKTAD